MGLSATTSMTEQQSSQLGLRANLPQFSLLILVNVFVGAMAGMERSILPLIAEKEFAIASHSAIFSFLISFGIVKACSNLFAGRFSDRIGRKKLLVLGWLVGLPVPLLLMWAPSWSWVVIANILLGVNQGLCWSTTVIMKIDLVGPRRRGLATGLNEFAGYLAVAAAAYASAIIAEQYGLRPFPFYLGVGCSLIGFLLSIVFIKETHHFTKIETAGELSRTSNPRLTGGQVEPLASSSYSFKQIFFLASWKNKTLFSCSQAGLVNNLNDGMAWGLFPLLYVSLGFSLQRVGFLAALYPAVWGVSQLFTGAMSDRWGRKWMIVIGMSLQAFAIFMVATLTQFHWQLTAATLLGVGTAMVYPTLLAAIGDVAHPEWRASAVGVYRLWRDLGYAIGAILSGVLADTFGIDTAVLAIGTLTLLSGCIVAWKFTPTQPFTDS